jgi:hypothetical protein
MTRLRIVLILLLFSSCISYHAAAQATIKTPAKKSRYLIFSTGGSTSLVAGNNGTLNVSFPYSVTDGTGVISTALLSKDIVPFPAKQLNYITPFDIELGTAKHFFAAQTSIALQNGSGINLSLGYGHNFYFDLFKGHSTDPTKAAFVFKPSINIAFSQFGRGADRSVTHTTSLGSIDNAGRSISLLGNVADSAFTIQRSISSGDDSDGTAETYNYDEQYNAQTLYVNFIHRELIVMPKIAISNNQNTHWFHWELSLGYQLSISQNDGVGLVQSAITSTKRNRVGGFIDLYKNKVATTYNKKVLTSSPFDLSGLYIGFKIGVVV